MPRHGLDTERVVQEAARIADADGLAEVTLARLAAALDVRPPSLYNHVGGRAALMRALSIRSLDELAALLRDATVGRSGPDALRALAHAYRAYAREHPGRYGSTVRAPAPGDAEHEQAAARALEVLLAVLARDGPGAPRELDRVGAPRGPGGGSELDRVGARRGPAEEQLVHRVRAVRAALHGFVAIESAGGFGLPLDLDSSFEFMLGALIAGLQETAGAEY